MMTGPAQTIERRAVYTAFGERIAVTGATDSRYGYVGAWQYQAPTTSADPLSELGWLHVGHRYYDPASGRFVQRDPIGIAGGLNTYAYVGATPTGLLDPEGLGPIGFPEPPPGSGPTGGLNPAVRPPGGQWLPQPPALPPGSPGYTFQPGQGWSPKPPTPLVPPWFKPSFPITCRVGGACGLAAAGGYLAGRGIDNAVGLCTGTSLSDRIGDWWWRVRYGSGGYRPY